MRVLDDLSTGRRGNLAHLDGQPGLTFFSGSATDPELVEPLVAESDVVFHLAAAVGVRLVVEQPVRTLSTNIKATELVLELAARHGAKVLVASTSEVYGKLDVERFAETDDLVLGPTHKSRWSYAASKIIDEHLALAYAREKGLAGHGAPPLQHHRAAPDGAVRHGRAALRAPGAHRRRRSPCTATASSGAPSPGWGTRCTP